MSPSPCPPARVAAARPGGSRGLRHDVHHQPIQEILWFERDVDGKPVQVVAEYHQEWINGYVATALKNKTGRVQAGPFRFRVKRTRP